MRPLFLALLIALMGVAVHAAPVHAQAVNPQPPREDGSIVHVVRSGDSIDGILIAYARYGVTRDDLRAYNNWRFEPDFIFVGDEIIVLPAGSVDPATGELLTTSPPPAPDAAPAESAPDAPPAEGQPAAPAALPVTNPANLAPPLILGEGDAPVVGIRPFLPAPAPEQAAPEATTPAGAQPASTATTPAPAVTETPATATPTEAAALPTEEAAAPTETPLPETEVAALPTETATPETPAPAEPTEASPTEETSAAASAEVSPTEEAPTEQPSATPTEESAESEAPLTEATPLPDATEAAEAPPVEVAEAANMSVAVSESLLNAEIGGMIGETFAAASSSNPQSNTLTLQTGRLCLDFLDAGTFVPGGQVTVGVNGETVRVDQSPFCFSTAATTLPLYLTAPEGYFVLGGSVRDVTVRAGQTQSIRVDLTVEGQALAALPTPDVTSPPIPEVMRPVAVPVTEESRTVFDYTGVILLGLAAIVLVSGSGLVLWSQINR